MLVVMLSAHIFFLWFFRNFFFLHCRRRWYRVLSLSLPLAFSFQMKILGKKLHPLHLGTVLVLSAVSYLLSGRVLYIRQISEYCLHCVTFPWEPGVAWYITKVLGASHRDHLACNTTTVFLKWWPPHTGCKPCCFLHLRDIIHVLFVYISNVLCLMEE